MDYKTYILILLIASMCGGCQKESTTIVYFINSTDDTVAVAHPYLSDMEIDAKDWLLKTKEISYSIYRCPPYLKKPIFGWLDENKYNVTPKDTFVCYIIPVNTARCCTWDSISKNKLALCKYELSFDNLQQLNYVIPYPPNSSVNGMNILNYQDNEE